MYKDAAPISQLTSTLMAVIGHGHLLTKEHAHFMCDNLECSLLVSLLSYILRGYFYMGVHILSKKFYISELKNKNTLFAIFSELYAIKFII